MADYETSVALKRPQKEAVEQYQEELKEEMGTEPTQGETVAIAISRARENGGM